MEITNKNTKIIMLAGKARAGKDTTASFIKEYWEKNNLKVINFQFSFYIKYYAKLISSWDGSEETKPRTLLQELGTEVIRNKLNKAEMFIERQIDDIEIYSYFYDAIIVPDIRLPKEIDSVKAKFDNVVAIHINRINFEKVTAHQVCYLLFIHDSYIEFNKQKGNNYETNDIIC